MNVVLLQLRRNRLDICWISTGSSYTNRWLWFRIGTSPFSSSQRLQTRLPLAPFHLPLPLPTLVGWNWELKAQKMKIIAWDKKNLLETAMRWGNHNSNNINNRSIRQRNHLHVKLVTNTERLFPTLPFLLTRRGHPSSQKRMFLPSPLSWQWFQVVLNNIRVWPCHLLSNYCKKFTPSWLKLRLTYPCE